MRTFLLRAVNLKVTVVEQGLVFSFAHTLYKHLVPKAGCAADWPLLVTADTAEAEKYGQSRYQHFIPHFRYLFK